MDKKDKLKALQDAWANCQSCGLCENRASVVFGFGNPDSPVMIVGEAPGQKEDEWGVPFVGAAGQLLDSYLGEVSYRQEVMDAAYELRDARKASDDDRQELQIKLRTLLLEEYYFTNVVMCHPLENREPLPKEIAACRSRLLQQIYIVDPVIIIAAGRIAAESIIGKKISVTQQRGELFDVDFEGNGIEYKYPVMVVLHPSYLLRKNDFRQEGGDGEKTYRDFLRAMMIVDEYNLRNYGIPKPKTRPKPEKR